MRPSEVMTLHEYVWWSTEHLFTVAQALAPEQIDAPIHFPFGSIRGTLAHITAALWIWRQRFALGQSPTALRDFAECATLTEVAAAFGEERESWRTFLAGLTQADLDASVTWKNTRGVEATQPLWLVLTHLVTHTMQHNAEVAQALTDVGHSPGGIDLVYWAVKWRQSPHTE